MFQSLGLKTPIILDNGSGYCKCGFASQRLPSVEFPAYVGRPKYNQTMSRIPREAYVGEVAQTMRGVLKLHYPIEHGIVTNWDDMEKVSPLIFNTNGCFHGCDLFRFGITHWWTVCASTQPSIRCS